jgi:hypothetical protein
MRKGYLSLVFGVVMVFLVACGGPTEESRQWADRFPAEITMPVEAEAGAEPVVWWEKTDDRTQFAIETQSRYGYATVSYEGDADPVEDTVAYITINTYANESSADVALEDAMLNWQLQGARFETERFGRDTFDFAVLNGGVLAYFQNDDTVFHVRIVPDDVEMTVPEDGYMALFETILLVLENAD